MLDSFVFFAMRSPLSSARLNALTQGTCCLIQICLYKNCFIQENNYPKGVKLLLLPTRDKEYGEYLSPYIDFKADCQVF